MRVKIGPYCDWFGPYQIAKKILFWMDRDDDRVHKLGDILSGKNNDSYLFKLCLWIDKKRKRKIKVHIDNYDTWNVEHTLALIIHPMLVKLKKAKQGAPYVDDEDVPENIRSTSAKPKENEWDTDEFFFDRWDYVLDEMIWAFEQSIDSDMESKFYSGKADFKFVPLDENDNETNESNAVKYLLSEGPDHNFHFDKESYDIHMNRMKNGLRLFSKYYYNLWS